MLANSYVVRFARLVSLCLLCQLPTPSASAPFLPFKHGSRQAQPSHASACPEGISRWYEHSGGCQFVCGRYSLVQEFFGRNFSKYDLPMESVFASKVLLTVLNNHKLTMMTLTGDVFAGFKMRRIFNVAWSLRTQNPLLKIQAA